MVAEKNDNGVKMRFTTPQIIIIVMLIVTLAVTVAGKADKAMVVDNCREIEVLKQAGAERALLLKKIDDRQIEILQKLSRVESLLEERGKGK